MKYIKKPIAIEATQYFDWMRERDELPDGVVLVYWAEFNDDLPTIKTLEGNHIVSNADFIITGIKGEKYPCKPDIFKATYYTEQEYAELNNVGEAKR